jgi:hypothetical protein
MKKFIIFTSIFVTSLVSIAAADSSFHCVPSANQSSDLDAGPEDGVISKITSLDIPSTQGNFNVSMSVEGVRALDQANGHTETQKMNLTYQLKERKTGTLMELQGSRLNDFNFDGIYLEFGNMDGAANGGPVPPGTYDAKIAMAFIDSNIYYKNTWPMMVKKVLFDCKATFTY